jgi:hypothetical protein
MPLWAWILLSIAGCSILLLFLFRVRYELNWQAGSDFSASLEYGLPGFMRPWDFSGKEREESISAESHKTTEKRRLSPKKLRGMIRMLSDRQLMKSLLASGFRLLRLAIGMLNMRIDCSVGYPDPARLGRAAGYWYAAQPFLTRRMQVHFRFQDQTPSLHVRLAGGFSAARVLAYGCMGVAALPWSLLARRAIAKLFPVRRVRMEGMA